jgi:hypothetical protein
MAANGQMAMKGDERGGERAYGLPCVSEFLFFSFSYFFLTYFLILTDADTVPNGRERLNGDKRGGDRSCRLPGAP